jgi:hypothetical protein
VRASATASHLARRFVGSLRPGGPGPEDERWALDQLLAAERSLWAALPGPDRRHAVGVARRVVDRLGERADRPVVAAALLHDVGKTASRLGTAGRVAATVVGLAGGRRRSAAWEARGGALGRVGRYLRHPEIGAELLVRAGSDPLTAAWAAEHHLPPERWSVPAAVGEALKAADDD